MGYTARNMLYCLSSTCWKSYKWMLAILTQCSEDFSYSKSCSDTQQRSLSPGSDFRSRSQSLRDLSSSTTAGRNSQTLSLTEGAVSVQCQIPLGFPVCCKVKPWPCQTELVYTIPRIPSTLASHCGFAQTVFATWNTLPLHLQGSLSKSSHTPKRRSNATS